MAGKTDIKNSVISKKHRNKLWSKQEIKTLRKLYPRTTKHQLVRTLNRTHFSICGMAHIMGLHKEFDDKFRPYRATERRLWSDEENQILKKMYPSHAAEEISTLIYRTSTAIIAQANKLKLKKGGPGQMSNAIICAGFTRKSLVPNLLKCLTERLLQSRQRLLNLELPMSAAFPGQKDM